MLVVVSHSLDQAVRLADRVVALREGKVVLDVSDARSIPPEALRRRIVERFPRPDPATT